MLKLYTKNGHQCNVLTRTAVFVYCPCYVGDDPLTWSPPYVNIFVSFSSSLTERLPSASRFSI